MVLLGDMRRSRDLGLCLSGRGDEAGMRVSVQGSGLTDRRTPPASPTEGRKPVHGRPQSLFHRYGGKGGPGPGSARADLSPVERKGKEKDIERHRHMYTDVYIHRYTYKLLIYIYMLCVSMCMCFACVCISGCVCVRYMRMCVHVRTFIHTHANICLSA